MPVKNPSHLRLADVDQVLEGVQNSTLVDHIPRRPTSPDVLLLLIPADGTRFDQVKFTPFDLQLELSNAAGVDDEETMF